MNTSSGTQSIIRRGPGAIAGLLVLVAVVISPFFHSPDLKSALTTMTPTFEGDQAAVERGSALFAAQCATCHGAGGKGDGPDAASLDPKPIDFTDPIHRGHTDADLLNWISNGVPGSAMPAFGATLSPAEIEDVIIFIRSLQANAPPEANVDVPDPADCKIAPKPPESLMPAGTVTPQPAPTKAPVVGPNSFVWPQGEEASQEEIDSITRSIHEFHACANAGDYPRRLALYTQRVLHAQFDALDAEGWRVTLEFAATPPAAVPTGDRQWIDSITAVRHLPDGRVGAYVAAVDPVNHPHQINAVVIFAKVGDRWLIDEVHEDPIGNMGFALTPTASTQIPVAGVETPITSADLVVKLVGAPTTMGNGAFAVEIHRANSDPVDDAQVELAIEMSDMSMGAQVVEGISDGDGIYRADVSLGMSGVWRVQVTIKREGSDPALFDFTFTVD